MGALILEKDILGPVFTNVYYAMNPESREMFIVDPAAAADRIEQRVSRMDGKPAAILLTHGHFDHILAAEEIRSRYQIPIYACLQEKEMLREPSVNMTDQFSRTVSLKADHYLSDLDVFTCAGYTIQMLHTPGHTAGSCCYYLKDEKILFSGDTLFCGSVGRTDFPGGSMAQMRQSLRRLLDTLPGDTDVYPGHDSATTIVMEKRYNPFA